MRHPSYPRLTVYLLKIKVFGLLFLRCTQIPRVTCVLTALNNSAEQWTSLEFFRLLNEMLHVYTNVSLVNMIMESLENLA